MKKIYLACILSGAFFSGTGFAVAESELAKIVVIQQKVIEQLKAEIQEVRTLAASAQTDASTAISKADNAQSTANTAVSKADQAQGTANSAVSKADHAQGTANTASAKADGAQGSANAAQGTASTAINRIADLPNQINTHSSDISGAVANRSENHVFHNLRHHISSFINIRFSTNGCGASEVFTGKSFTDTATCLSFK